VSLLALGLIAASAPAIAASQTRPDPLAKAAKKKKCKKGKKSATAAKKKKKCKKAPAAQTPSPPATGATNPPPPPPPPPPPDTRTTEQKIDDAVASGEITAEQGLIYKVFSAFHDSRLPGQYVGAPNPFAGAPLDTVTAQWDQLSATAKATLGPFLIPPMHEGSYWEQLIQGTTTSATSSAVPASPRAAANPNSPWCTGNAEVVLADWSFVEATSGAAAGKVRIWYQNRFAATDGALAATLLGVVQTKIWPALTTLMQREPLPDGGSTESCAGGSDALDIALVDADDATTIPTLGQENTPVHIVFPRAGSRSTSPYVAHEFMHAIQYSFTLSSGDMSSGENKWLKESTAQWAQDYVSDSQYGVGLAPNDTEHRALQYFFPFPDESLDSSAKTYHEYGKYVFWLWAARKGNDPTIVRQVWSAVATQKSLNAAKSLFGSGWAQAWKDFTKSNWNQDPVPDYKTWDRINDTPKLELDGAPLRNEVRPVITSVPPVAAKYLKFLPVTGLNKLTYRNLGGLSDEAGVQAIFTYKDDSHAVEDWTQIAQQDVPLCNVKELTLVLSNASVTPNNSRAFSLSFSPPSPGAAREAAIDPRAAVCVPDPVGSFSGTGDYDNGVGTTLHYSWNGTADFDPFGPGNPWFPEYSTEVWDSATVVSGSVTLSGNGISVGSDETCTIDIPAATYEFGAGDGTMMIQPGPEPHYGIQLNFPANQLPDATISCPDSGSSTIPFTPPGHLIYTLEPEQASVRGTYQGSQTISTTNLSESYTWSFSDPAS
jgi:hypothetical protein